MSLDVSIYSSRVKSGYLDTVASGTSRPIGSAPYSSASGSGGGGTSGVVRTTGVQRVTGTKYWDASANFTYDISLGGIFIVKGTDFDVSIGGVSSAQDGSALVYNDGHWTYGTGGDSQPFDTLTVTNDASIGGDLYIDGTLKAVDIYGENTYYQNLNVSADASVGGDLYIAGTLNVDVSLSWINDVSVSGAVNGKVLTYDGTYWVPEDVSNGGISTFTNITVTDTATLSNGKVKIDTSEIRLYSGIGINCENVGSNLGGFAIISGNNLDVENGEFSNSLTLNSGANLMFQSPSGDDTYSIEIDTSIQYIGSKTTNGSWRFYVDADSSLVFERRISGTWTHKGSFSG